MSRQQAYAIIKEHHSQLELMSLNLNGENVSLSEVVKSATESKIENPGKARLDAQKVWPGLITP